MKGKYILALDQGTTSSRSVLFDAAGKIVHMEQQEFPQIYPQPGWVEHNAREIWTTQLATATRALEQAHLTAKDLAGIGITNQRETIVAWDRTTGEPLHHAIVWQDRRTASQTDQLKEERTAEMIREKTGLLPDPYFSASKMRWLLDEVDGLREKAEDGSLAFGTIDSWLIYKLTGGAAHVTDVSNASRTMLCNIHTGEWDDELLALFTIPKATLPEIVPSSGQIAKASDQVLSHAVPITGIAGDQQAALFGQLCFEPGLTKNTYGTGCFLLMQTGETPIPSQTSLLTTIAWQLDGQPIQYALEGSVFVGGAAIQWLRDELGIIDSASQINELASSVPDTGGVCMVPAFTGLGAPYWDPDARGIIIGLTRGTSPAHLARATLEGIAHQVADVVKAMEKDAGSPLSELRVDGGASASDLLLQMEADLLNCSVERPEITETTALGAAYLAGLGAGVWKDTQDLCTHRKTDRTFTSSMSEAERTSSRQIWQKAVERAKGWAS